MENITIVTNVKFLHVYKSGRDCHYTYELFSVENVHCLQERELSYLNDQFTRNHLIIQSIIQSFDGITIKTLNIP